MSDGLLRCGHAFFKRYRAVKVGHRILDLALTLMMMVEDDDDVVVVVVAESK